jgi:MFS family permease
MKEQRWLRIIPVALIMYTISYIDRTNVSLALDPRISSMMRDLGMDDEKKGFAAGIFFIGYVLLQIPGGYLAGHWSAKKFIALLLVFWGVCAVGCGLVHTYAQFAFMRFMLGVAESGVFPATLVLLAQWFPRTERARANAFWNLCQPLAVAGSAPVTAVLLKYFGWKTMLIVEGVLPFVWLPIWLSFISDHPREAKWISAEEKEHLERTLQAESAVLATADKAPLWQAFLQPAVFVMLPIYFLQNSANYGLMTFLGEGLKGKGMAPLGATYGILFAIPYAVAAVLMILNARHSDKTHERRGHVAIAYAMSGTALIGSVLVRPYSFWGSYACLCLAVPGPFAGLAPFWAIPAETMPPRVLGAVMGLVNAIGNLGGHYGNKIVGQLKQATGSINVPFEVLGGGLLVAAALCFLLPRSRFTAQVSRASAPSPSLTH